MGMKCSKLPNCLSPLSEISRSFAANSYQSVPNIPFLSFQQGEVCSWEQHQTPQSECTAKYLLYNQCWSECGQQQGPHLAVLQS